jgi:hypothetical protein
MLNPERIPDLAGNASPRIGPPVPAKSLLPEYRASAKAVGIKPMPWQLVTARYLTATAKAHWVFREVCIVVARQNGKTTILLPLIHQRLKAGRRILHTAQNRSLPRETFLELAQRLQGDPDVTEIRYANGQEIIKFKNGGRYTLVAPTKSGARGHGVDDVILDEVREQRSFELVASIKPAITASRNPQIIYLSNAGDSDSVVLNDLRRRMDSDPRLAYLEWSARPDRMLDDRAGWAEANPALGITIQPDTLEDFYGSLPAPVWETEHLCRWVISMQPRLVAEAAWMRLRSELEPPRRPMLGISMSPDGTRAAAALAWPQSDGTVALKIIADVTGDPIDTDRLGTDLRERALRSGVVDVGWDTLTDGDLARYFKKTTKITGRDYANASASFVQLVDSGRLRWDEADSVTEDLVWTSRKPYEAGAWTAVRAKEDRPIPASLAAIRAVWLASGFQPGPPRVM